MVSMLTPSVVGREFDAQPGETKDYEIGIYCIARIIKETEQRLVSFLIIYVICNNTNDIFLQLMLIMLIICSLAKHINAIAVT